MRTQTIGKSIRAMIMSTRGYSWVAKGNRRRFER